MSGENGTKYVTLAGDKKAHLLAGDRTSCGLYVPVYGDAEWGYTATGTVCSACEKAEDKFAGEVEERAPFEEGVEMVDESPPALQKYSEGATYSRPERPTGKNKPAAKAPAKKG